MRALDEQLAELGRELAQLEHEQRRLEVAGTHPTLVLLKRIEVFKAKRRIADFLAQPSRARACKSAGRRARRG